MNASVNMDGACQEINEGRLGVVDCMGEWEWLQAAINGQEE